MLIVISGPSGVGKTTIIDRMLHHPDMGPELKFSVSATTRKPRPGEIPDVSYHYMTVQEFERLVGQDAFIEWAHVHGNMYGTPVSELHAAREQGRDLLLEIDVQGAAALRGKFPDALMIFLKVSGEMLRKRLLGRPSALSPQELEKEIELRMNNAKEELEQAGHYDHIVENRDLDVTVDTIISIIREERTRRAQGGAEK